MKIKATNWCTQKQSLKISFYSTYMPKLIGFRLIVILNLSRTYGLSCWAVVVFELSFWSFIQIFMAMLWIWPVTLKYVRQILYLAPTVWEFSVSHSTIDKVCTCILDMYYRVSHSKEWKVILLWWGHKFRFLLLLFWILNVH